MTEINQEHRSIEKAIDAYVSATNDVGSFVTGWLIVASLSSPGHDTNQTDGYVSIASDGLPHHTQLGLLTVALDDKKNITLAGMLHSMLYEDDEEELE